MAFSPDTGPQGEDALLTAQAPSEQVGNAIVFRLCGAYLTGHVRVGIIDTVRKHIDEIVVGNGIGLFLIVGHWSKILPHNSKGAS